MKILFVVEIQNIQHKEQSELILDSLKSLSYSAEVWEIGDNYFLKTDFFCFSNPESLNEKSYDLVVAFNKNALKNINEYVTRKKLPLIYLINADEINLQFPEDLRLISTVFLIDSFGKNADFLLPKSLVNPLQLIEELPEMTELVKPIIKKPKLLVYIEEKESRYPYVLQLIPVFNLWVKMQIIIMTNGDEFPRIYSSHITIQNIEKTKLADEISNSDIVLGNGNIIQKAIVLCKPCIIVGERGFGGIVTPDNFKTRIKNGFLGRIGGELNEYIPERVIWDSVLDILDWNEQQYKELLTANYNLLQNQKTENEMSFEQIIQKVSEKHRNIDKNSTIAKLTVSGIFGIAQATKEKYVLVNKSTRQIHANLEKEETDIIGLFKEPCTVGDALERSEYSSEPEEFNAFVSELVNEKILDIYED
jgi:hypothetical protein